MTDLDDIREQQQRSHDIYAIAVKIRELLQDLQTVRGEAAAERALAIVTGDAT